MRFLITAILLIAGVPEPETQRSTAASPSRRVMSFNIRYDNPGDGEHAWPNRRDLVSQIILFHGTDLLGVQEALEHQVRQLDEALAGFGWVGVGRSDGKAAGEFTPIFYREDRLELLESGTFWLSPAPEEPGSKGWDAALPRIATWAKLRDRAAGRTFLAMNTHFDHVGEEARRRSASLIVEKATALAGELPIILLGDFNAEPDSVTYQTLAGAFRDAREESEGGHFGPHGTFGTFEPRKEPARRIDYIFIRDAQVIREATLADHWDGRHASDHWPVFAEVRWQAAGAATSTAPREPA